MVSIELRVYLVSVLYIFCFSFIQNKFHNDSWNLLCYTVHRNGKQCGTLEDVGLSHGKAASLKSILREASKSVMNITS